MPVTRSIGYTRRVKVKDLVELRFPSLGRGRKDLIKILDVLARSLVGALINLADHGGFEPKCLPVTHGVHPRTHWRRPDPCREPVLVARFGRSSSLRHVPMNVGDHHGQEIAASHSSTTATRSTAGW